MKILFYCGHPAHFHLIKNPAKKLLDKGNSITIAIKSKDVLEELVIDSGFKYYKISNITSSARFIKYFDAIIRLIKYAFFIKINKFDLLVGTSWENSKIGYLLNIPSICLNEDDAKIVPLFSKNAYPKSNAILTPISCDDGIYSNKTIKYNSFHELAYLHPNNFNPSHKVLEKYIKYGQPYFILRFAKLFAHHDKGINGINITVANKLIEALSVYGNVYITSERKLEKELEPYRISINAEDMHHIMAFASIYIGDSQTMAAEAGVLGVPFIRFNDFVGRIGYLDELEKKYQLGFGIKTTDVESLYKKVEYLLKLRNRREIFQERRRKMLSEKIDYAAFLVWFIENYPDSVQMMKKQPNYQLKFQ